MRTTFETSWGPMAVEWSPRGLTRLDLPPAAGRGGDEPPAFVRRAVAAVRHYLETGRRRLDAPLDLDACTPFTRRVYDALRATAPGDTLTYAELAARAGRPGAARAAGAAMARNPLPLFVPCHRVLAAGGGLGGFSAPGGVSTKQRLLALERRAPAPRRRSLAGARGAR